MKIKKIITLIILFASVVSLFVFTQYLPNVEAKTTSIEEDLAQVKKFEKEIANIQAKNQQLLKEIEKVKKEANNQNKLKDSLEKEILYYEQEIETTENLLTQYGLMINKREAEIKQLELDINENFNYYIMILKQDYMKGDYTYLELIFNSKSLADFLTSFDTVSRLLEYNKSVINNLQSDKDKLEVVKSDLVGIKKELDSQKVQLDAVKEETEKKKIEAEKMVTALKSDEKKHKAYYEKGEEELAKLDKEVGKLLAEIAKKRAYIGGEFIFPLPIGSNTYVSSPYGMRRHPVLGVNKFHNGIDLPAKAGTPIYASNGGEVIMSKSYSGYGNCVIIDHGGGYSTLYAHASSLKCKEGDIVKQGDTIALVGTTGISTGNHLHFEIRVNGDTIDPLTKIILPYNSEFAKKK